MLEYLNIPWTQWTGTDLIQVALSIAGVIIVYALIRAIILAGTKKE
jgi:hypothetical protein